MYHRLGKLDTLAGLAIRYGVTVSDLKRANGLHSEMGIFALRELKVPKGQLPPSHSGFQALLSQKRDPPAMPPAPSSALDELRSHYGTGRLHSNGGGPGSAAGRGGEGPAETSGAGVPGEGGGSRLGSEGVAAEVLREAAEQLDRQKQVTLKDISVSDKGGGDGDSGGFNSLKKRGSNGEMDGGGSISPEIQRLRERMGGIGDSMPVGPSRAPPAGAAARRPLFTEGQGPGRAVRDGRESQTGALRSGSGRSFFQKLKQVAQQPALAGPPRSSIPLLEIGGAAAGGGGGDWGSSSTPSSQRTTPKAAEDPKGAGGIVRGGTARPGGSGGKGPSKGRKAD